MGLSGEDRIPSVSGLCVPKLGVNLPLSPYLGRGKAVSA